MRVTAWAFEGPLLVTVMVYVRLVPAMTGSELSALRSATSAWASMTTVSVPLSGPSSSVLAEAVLETVAGSVAART